MCFHVGPEKEAKQKKNNKLSLLHNSHRKGSKLEKVKLETRLMSFMYIN